MEKSSTAPCTLSGRKGVQRNTCELANGASEIAELEASGALVTAARRRQMQLAAQRHGGTTDVEQVLQRLRGEIDSLLAAAARLDSLVAEIESAHDDA